MSASKGQLVEVQITSGRWSLAAVSKIISGDTVNLVAFTDGVDPWPTISTPNGLIAGSITSVAKGTGVGEWRELALPVSVSDAIAAAIDALASDTSNSLANAVAIINSNMASEISRIEDNFAQLPAAGSDHTSLGFGAQRTPSATRGTWVTASGSYQITSALLGNQTATVDILSDSGSNPTTLRARAPGAVVGVVSNITIPWFVAYWVPPGHSYKLVESHTANVTVSIAMINESPC